LLESWNLWLESGIFRENPRDSESRTLYMLVTNPSAYPTILSRNPLIKQTLINSPQLSITYPYFRSRDSIKLFARFKIFALTYLYLSVGCARLNSYLRSYIYAKMFHYKHLHAAPSKIKLALVCLTINVATGSGHPGYPGHFLQVIRV